MFFRPFAKESGGAGIGRRRAHHRIDGGSLALVFQAVQALMHIVFHLFPMIPFIVRGDGQQLLLFVVEQSDQHFAIGTTGEEQLHIGCHRHDILHAFAGKRQLQEREQTEESGVVSEAQRCAMTATRDDGIGFRLYILPQGDTAAGGNTIVERGIAVDDGHALIIRIVHGKHLLGRKTIPEVDVQRNILHIASDGVQFRQ